MEDGDLANARAFLHNAIDRKHNEHHFYHQLAIINQKLGETDAMMENLRLAQRHSRGAEQERFSGKLQTLERILSSSQ